MSEFTKGEWTVYGDWGVCFSGDRDRFSTVDTRCKEPNLSNLNLIAAAPEMYEFIEMVANSKGADLEALNYMAVSWARNAEKLLAKARGE